MQARATLYEVAAVADERSPRCARRAERRREIFACIMSRLGVRTSVRIVANARPPATDDAS